MRLCAFGQCSGQFWEFPMIEPRVPPHQEYHKWRSSSPHQVSHSTPRRETSGLTPTSHSVRGERSWALPEFASNPEKRTPSLILGAHPTLREKLQDQASPRSSQHLSSMRIPAFTGSSYPNDSPISTEAVANGSGYHGMPISTIKRINSSSYGRIPTRKSCR